MKVSIVLFTLGICLSGFGVSGVTATSDSGSDPFPSGFLVQGIYTRDIKDDKCLYNFQGFIRGEVQGFGHVEVLVTGMLGKGVGNTSGNVRNSALTPKVVSKANSTLSKPQTHGTPMSVNGSYGWLIIFMSGLKGHLLQYQFTANCKCNEEGDGMHTYKEISEVGE